MITQVKRKIPLIVQTSHHIKTIRYRALFTPVCLNPDSYTKENPGHMHLSVSATSEFTHD